MFLLEFLVAFLFLLYWLLLVHSRYIFRFSIQLDILLSPPFLFNKPPASCFGLSLMFSCPLFSCYTGLHCVLNCTCCCLFIYSHFAATYLKVSCQERVYGRQNVECLICRKHLSLPSSLIGTLALKFYMEKFPHKFVESYSSLILISLTIDKFVLLWSVPLPPCLEAFKVSSLFLVHSIPHCTQRNFSI